MARRRYVSTDVSIDKRLNILAVQHGDFAAMLYTWMIPHAADDATLNGDLDEFIASVIPMRRDKSNEDVRAALSAMCDLGLIAWDGAKIYFPTEPFYRFQTYVPADKRRVGDFAAPSGDFAAERRETPLNAEGKDGLNLAAISPLNAAYPSPSPSPSPSLSPSAPLPTAPPAPRRGTTRVVPLSEDERSRILAEFPGSEESIDLALSHKAHKNYPENQYGYVRNWVRRDFERRAAGNGRAEPPPQIFHFVNDEPDYRADPVPGIRVARLEQAE